MKEDIKLKRISVINYVIIAVFGVFSAMIIHSIYLSVSENHVERGAKEIEILEAESDKISPPPWVILQPKRVTSLANGRPSTVSYVIEIEKDKIDNLISYYDSEVKKMIGYLRNKFQKKPVIRYTSFM